MATDVTDRVGRGQLAISVAGVVAALAWAIFRAGPTVTPSLGTIVDSARVWPERLSGEFAAFYADSPVGLLIFRVTGATDSTLILRWSALFMIIALAGWAWWAWLAVGDSQRWRAARLAVLAPLTGVLATWLGFYDPFTMLAWLAVLFAWWSGSRSLLIAAGVLLGFQHFEHGVFGIAALALTWWAVRLDLPDRLQRSNPLWILVGVLIGKAILLVVMAASGSALSGRTSWLSTYLLDWTKVGVNTAPILLWSLFAGAWALVIAYWLSQVDRRSRALLLAAFAVGVVATVLSGDRPRVFIIVMAPALLILTLAYLRRRATHTNELRLVETIMWVAPAITLWGAEVVYSNALDQAITTWQLLIG